MAGVVCGVAGVLGLFLPLVPGTPLLLLSAASFAYSSEKMYRFLLDNKISGPPIRDYQEKRAIRPRSKISALIFLWTSIGISAIFFVPVVPVKFLLVAIAAAVTVFILRIKTLREG